MNDLTTEENAPERPSTRMVHANSSVRSEPGRRFYSLF